MDEYNAITELMELIPNENKAKARIIINQLTTDRWEASKRKFYKDEKTIIHKALDKALYYTFEYSLEQSLVKSKRADVCSIRQIIAYYLIVNLSSCVVCGGY